MNRVATGPQCAKPGGGGQIQGLAEGGVGGLEVERKWGEGLDYDKGRP